MFLTIGEIDFWPSKLNIGTPVAPILANVHIVVFLHFLADRT